MYHYLPVATRKNLYFYPGAYEQGRRSDGVVVWRVPPEAPTNAPGGIDP